MTSSTRRASSLKAIARDLRERNVPTVTGTAWSAKTLRDVLIKPAVAGLAVQRGEDGEPVLVDAPWNADPRSRTAGSGCATC